jgi:uncharacterized protein with gpF-like domain
MPVLQLNTGIKPADAIAVLEKRLANPVQTFHWTDLWQHDHARAFTVAKSAGFDILDDIADAVAASVGKGLTERDFEKLVTPALIEKGWVGRKPVLDPETGQMVNAELGTPRRLLTIYDTNMRMSYNAGRWASIMRNVEDQPWLLYLHGGSRHPRPEHLAWDHTCLPADDPWWNTHFTPNGWGCSCQVVALSDRQKGQMEGAGLLKLKRPALKLVAYTNPRTGEISEVPEGIDPGFAYNPGQAFLATLQAA